jgi:hypothetical protein
MTSFDSNLNRFVQPLQTRGIRQNQLVYSQLLGGNIADIWHPNFGVRLNSLGIASWDGLVHGTSLVASGNPTFVADGTTFGSKKIIKCTTSGSNALHNSSAPTFLAAGSHPWVLIRGRWRTVPGADSMMIDLGVAGSSNLLSIASRSGAGQGSQGDINTIAQTGVTPTDVCNFECWSDGVKLFAGIDGATAGVANVAGLTTAVTSIALGQTGGATWFSDLSIALVIIAPAYPGADIASRIRAFAETEFPK